MLPFRLRQRLFGSNNPPSAADADAEASTRQSGSKSEDGLFYPNLWDVLKVRYLLQRRVSKEGLPVELVDTIVDAAEYWPSTWRRMEGGKRVVVSDRDQVLLKTVPLCYDRKSLEQSVLPRSLPHRTAHPCRKIVFNISSHDQGHGPARENMYESSWTWFDTEAIRGAHARNMYANGSEQELLDNERGQEKKHYSANDDLLLPRNNKLQVNGAHVSESQNAVITWHYLDDIQPESSEAYEIERSKGRGRFTLDGHGVRELEVGDSIALWARARFPGWRNHVDQASVRIFWAV